jgi:predicted permease
MIVHDLNYAFKAVLRRPGLSLAVVLILALGIGATTTIFSVTSSVLLSKIPFKDGDRLVVIKVWADDGSPSSASYLDVQSWRQQSRTLEQISINTQAQELNVSGGDRAERVKVGFASASYLDLLGIQPALGRTFLPEDENRSSPVAVTVISNNLWQRRFGGDPAIVGRGIQIQGLAFQVIGVLPKSFRDVYHEIDVYVPVTMARWTHREGYVEDRGLHWLGVFARRRPGVSLDQANQEMRAISDRLAATFPKTNSHFQPHVDPIRTSQFDYERMRNSILIMLMGAALLLLIACTNVTNLLLVRAVERRKEVALRLALGGTRFRLMRQSVFEGAILGLAGAALGVGAAFFTVGLLDNYFANLEYHLPDFLRMAVDLRALGVALALTVLISFVNGLVPARESLKTNLQEELQLEGKGHTPSAGSAFIKSFLVVSAVFFSVVLLVGSGLVIKSLRALTQDNPGFRTEHVLFARFELPTTQFRDDAPVYQLYKRILEKARTLPDVADTGLWAPGLVGASIYLQFIVPEGHSLEAPEEKVRIYEHRITPGLLRKMGITLVAGREFTEQDDAKHPRVGILSRSTTAALWPSQDPIGRHFWLGAPHNVWVEVVGVANDADLRGRLVPDHDYRRDVYFPLFQERSRTTVVLLLTRREGQNVREQLSQLTQTIAPDIPVYDVQTLEERRRREEGGARLNAVLLIFFASSALLLAVVGIYSILTYTVRQQRFELGIRVALGADQPDILRHFIWKGTALLGLGLLAGLAGALGLAKSLSTILFNVNPNDPLVFIAVPLLVALFSLPAILRPAYRAMRATPSSLLRLR